LCDFLYPFKTLGRIILGRTCLVAQLHPYCLTSGIKNKNLWLICFNILTGPYPIVHRNESVLKNILKKGVRGDKGWKITRNLEKELDMAFNSD